MLFITSALLGVSAAFLRSALSLALVAVLIVITFLGACLFSAGDWAFATLAYALLGYDFGLFSLLCGYLLARRLRLI